MPRLHADGRVPAIVVALGGNALMPPEGPGEIGEQFTHARTSLEPVVALAGGGWNIAVVHGNGPQIGDELLRHELARDALPPLPLGVLVASTAGWIGYMIQQSLENALSLAGVSREVVTLVTQVLVDPADPATREPVKPVGRVMDERTARALERDLGWSVAESSGGWRRLAPSPRPVALLESAAVRRLVQDGTIVIAAGGGGTPVYRDPRHGLEGVDGVVDKDLSAEVLAREIGASVLLGLTNVEGVYRGWGSPDQELIRRLSLAEAEALLETDELARGSMAPKLEAAARFVRAGGACAIIARLDQGAAAMRGEAGTAVTR